MKRLAVVLAAAVVLVVAAHTAPADASSQVAPQTLSQCYWNRGNYPAQWVSVRCVSGSGYIRAAATCKHYTSSGAVNGVTYDTGNWVGPSGTSWAYCPHGWRLTSWSVQHA